MTIRTFWLNLGWLVMLVVTVAVPLALDTVDRLTYIHQPGFVGSPHFLPVARVQHDHGGRHRATAACAALDRRDDRPTWHRARLPARAPDAALPGLQRARGRLSVSVVSARGERQHPDRGTALLCDGPGGHASSSTHAPTSSG